MSRSASIDLPFPDETRTYRLGIGELRQLQEKCDRGPMEILQALTLGRWRVDDIIQPIRLGLIGGGMKIADANTLVEKHIQTGALAEACVYAALIVNAAITGAPDEEIDMPKGAQGGKTTTPETGSASASSTDKEPVSDGHPARSIN
jgi:hypothetical protein